MHAVAWAYVPPNHLDRSTFLHALTVVHGLLCHLWDFLVWLGVLVVILVVGVVVVVAVVSMSLLKLALLTQSTLRRVTSKKVGMAGKPTNEKARRRPESSKLVV